VYLKINPDDNLLSTPADATKGEIGQLQDPTLYLAENNEKSTRWKYSKAIKVIKSLKRSPPNRIELLFLFYSTTRYVFCHNLAITPRQEYHLPTVDKLEPRRGIIERESFMQATSRD